METLSGEAAVRAELLNYLLLVKEFYSKLWTTPIVTKMETLLPSDVTKSNEPTVVWLGRAERWWLNNLFVCLCTIEQLLTNIEQWREWFLKLVHNLEFTDENISRLTKGPEVVYETLMSRKMDEGYVRLVVNNATADFMDLIAKTRQLLDQIVRQEIMIAKLNSPMLEIIEKRLERIKDVNYVELLNQMQQLLAATYNAPTQENFFQNLSALVHIFGGWRRMLQLDDPSLDDPKAMQSFVNEARVMMNTLNILTKDFENFVKARSIADYYVHQAELSIIRMMLTYEGSAEEWWVDYLEAETEEIANSIPESLDPHQLLIGVTHSLALLEDLDQRLIPQMPNIKTTVGKLGEFLQSPTIRLYEEINQIRLVLWDEYRQQWLALLIKLRGILQKLMKRLEIKTP